MCLAVPARVIQVSATHAEVDIIGVRTQISSLLVDDLKAGDKVLVHAGFAINKIDDEYFDFLEDTVQSFLGDSP